ncbi:phage holin family protein [Campylobacter majalis]|uniref:phage holin family protein n=1 Tax=Campylobacter majalis TaxID=2790656 RepID=UPI003D6885E8
MNSLDEFLGNYKWVLSVGFIGGLLNIGSRADKTTGRKFADLVIGLISSMFFGWISYEVILFIWASDKVALAGCGFFAWKGATWVGEKVDKFVDNKIERMS